VGRMPPYLRDFMRKNSWLMHNEPPGQWEKR
jgi:hypothetical protein